MLHIPNISYNLLSIGKITKALNCLVILTSSGCTFQDSVTGRTIGHGKEKDRLYYLDTNWKTSILRSQGLDYTSSSKVDQIWLWHRHLGHPPFPFLKKVFQSLFKNFDCLDFHSEVCLLAKAPSSFISNKKL